jgi:[ribosomal protein S5]-alanine N-acetyltransferase
LEQAVIDLQAFQIATARTCIRPITEADLDALYAVYSDPEVMRYTSDPPFSDRTLMQQFFTSVQYGYQSAEYYELAVVLLPHTPIGTCSLHSFAVAQAAAEVGFILHRAYWRQGLMTEALWALLHYAFSQLQLQRIYADVDETNLAARSLLTKLGFQPVAGTTTRLLLARSACGL